MPWSWQSAGLGLLLLTPWQARRSGSRQERSRWRRGGGIRSLAGSLLASAAAEAWAIVQLRLKVLGGVRTGPTPDTAVAPHLRVRRRCR
jgi:hypothetical protein